MKTYFINIPEDKGKKYQQINFPAGEIHIRLNKEELPILSESEKVVAIFRTVNLAEIIMVHSALIGVAGLVSQFVFVFPYLPYGRADRKFVEGDCDGLEAFCATVPFGESITFDAHPREEILDAVGVQSVDPLPQIRIAISDHTVRPTILLPDKGAMERYGSMSFGNFPVKYCTKVRDAATGELSAFEVPEIETGAALIVDDICDGGRTFIGIANKIKEKQPNVKLRLYVSHGIFSKGLNPLASAGIEKIYTTDSFHTPNDLLAAGTSEDYLVVMPVDGALKAAVCDMQELCQQSNLQNQKSSSSDQISPVYTV